MALTEMQKIHMAVHKSVSEELIHKLQELGCCQFIQQDNDRVDEKTMAPLRSKLRHVEDLLGEVRFVARFLEPFATEKGSGMARAMGDMPEYSLDSLAELASEDKFRELSSRLRDLEKRLSDARAGMSRVRGLIAQLLPIQGLPYPLDLFNRGTDRVAGLLLAVPKQQFLPLTSALEGTLGEMVEISSLPTTEKDTSQTIAVLYARERSDDLLSVLEKHTASRVDVPSQFALPTSEELDALRAELAKLEADEREVVADIAGIANEGYRTSQLCSDYWGVQKAKADALSSGEQTEQIMLLSFWLPADCLDTFKASIKPYEALTETALVEPGDEEKPPTLLRNPAWASPIEPLTEMYGTPTYGGVDPTMVVAPFFYLFFGMCFGDAGYGLLIAGILIFLMMRKQLSGTLKKFFLILTIGNVAAVVMGTITFSWFGDSISSFPFLKALMPLQSFQLLDPMNDPMTMLYISLALGFIQIMVGLLIAMRENLRKGDKLAALADQGGWIVFLCGLVLIGLSSAGTVPLPTKASGAIAILGALILVATQGREKESLFGKLFSGVMSLYNVTGYLGDVLSYSRLLALGLGSAAVGMVINLLARLVADIPGVGILLGILIFVLGHLFSIAVNILGAFIHSLRLQYVEFFGKFYEASGEDFSPLRVSTQYVKVSEPTPNN